MQTTGGKCGQRGTSEVADDSSVKRGLGTRVSSSCGKECKHEEGCVLEGECVRRGQKIGLGVQRKREQDTAEVNWRGRAWPVGEGIHIFRRHL